MFQLDLKSRKSIYEQVMDSLKELIISGELPEDSKLPSVRELSKTIMCNPNTVQKAYRELEHQGFVYSTSGLGTFVAARGEKGIDAVAIEAVKQKLASDVKELAYLGLDEEGIQRVLAEVLAERGNRK